MPQEDQSQKAVTRAQKARIDAIVTTRLPVPEGEARKIIAQIDGLLKGPYFDPASHPPFNLLKGDWPPELKINDATVALGRKKEKLLELIAQYEFEKAQLAAVQQSPIKGVLTIAAFTVSALFLAALIRKFR